MELSRHQVQAESLTTIAADACRLLIAGEYDKLANQFGYAVALGRSPSQAIREDLASSLTQPGEALLELSAPPRIEIRYFEPPSELHALAECLLDTEAGNLVLVELVVSATGNTFHATLEQVSAAA